MDAIVLSSTAIMVSWERVTAIDRNGIITQYEIEYIPLNTFMGQIGRNTTLVESSTMSLNRTNLEEYVNYTISVRALTVVGGGPYSEALTHLTLEDGK